MLGITMNTSPNHEPSELQPETLAISAGRPDDQISMAPVMFASTTYEMGSLEEGRKMAHSTKAGKFYGRHGNPTVQAFESAVAELEGAEAARARGQGQVGEGHARYVDRCS